MLNHLHFIGSAPDLIATVRDMKTFLSKEMQKNIIATEPEVIELFKDKDSYHFWQDNNYPELITSEEFLEQKFNYIHYNPVRKEYIHYPEDWKWSSASKVSTRIAIESL
jgi:REP element-mobilizing transposase RayT